MNEPMAIGDRLGRTQSRRKAGIRLATLLLLLPLLVFTTGVAEPGSRLMEWLQDAGVALIFAGILGRAWSTLYIGGRKLHELVTAGPYSMSRNPLYLFSFAAMAGLGLQTGSVLLAVLCVGAAYAIFLPVVRHEEAALVRIHGQRFETYLRSVPRFLPALRLWREAPELTVDPVRWRMTVLDALFFLSLVPVVRCIGGIQTALDLPVLSLF